MLARRRGDRSVCCDGAVAGSWRPSRNPDRAQRGPRRTPPSRRCPSAQRLRLFQSSRSSWPPFTRLGCALVEPLVRRAAPFVGRRAERSQTRATCWSAAAAGASSARPVVVHRHRRARRDSQSAKRAIGLREKRSLMRRHAPAEIERDDERRSSGSAERRVPFTRVLATSRARIWWPPLVRKRSRAAPAGPPERCPFAWKDVMSRLA